jgi:cyanophycin synthetase
LAEATSPTNWELLRPSRAYGGFAYGFRYPCIAQLVAVAPMSAEDRTSARTRVQHALAALDLAPIAFPDLPSDEDAERATLGWFLQLADHLNALAELPVLDSARCIASSPGTALYAVPCLAKGLGPMTALLDCLRAIARDPKSEDAELDGKIRRSFRRLRTANGETSNGPRFLRAAVEAGIPVQELPSNVVQYGLGRNSVLLESSLTQYTSAIGMRIASNKAVTAQYLRRFRLPAAAHFFAASADEAVRHAERLGYPVVIKPADKDGGVAVRADLRNEAEVREAFNQARDASQRVLVEKHVPGRDYRLLVFRGRMIWAVERRPAGVTGDGKRSIAQLVEAVNADPARGAGPHGPLKRLKLDQEALDLLARDGMTPETVPEAGQLIRLRSAANVASGGTPVAVQDIVHPENALLAVRAAQALKLDIAGIDLIIPDIATPWQEGGAVICEINAQPQLGGITSRHIYPHLLEGLLQGDGAIPVIGFLGANRADQLARQTAAELAKADIAVGLHLREGVAVAGSWIERGKVDCLSAGRILSAHQRVEALLLGAIDEQVLRFGLPVPRIDLLVVSGEQPLTARGGEGLNDDLTVELLRLLLPSCAKVVAVAGEEEVDDAISRALRQLNVPYRSIRRDELADLVSGLFQPKPAAPQR